MASAWRALAEIALPVPLLLLALLLAPAPRSARVALLRIVDRVLTLPVLGSIALANVMQAITGAALLGAARDAVRLGRAAKMDVSPSVTAANLAKRWRAERNAWLAALAFVAWTLLARVHVLVRRLVALEDAALERARPAAAAFLAAGRSGAGTVAAAPAGGGSGAPPAAPAARARPGDKKTSEEGKRGEQREGNKQ